MDHTIQGFWLLFGLVEALAHSPSPQPLSRPFGSNASLGEGLSFDGVGDFQIPDFILGQNDSFIGTSYKLAQV